MQSNRVSGLTLCRGGELSLGWLWTSFGLCVCLMCGSCEQTWFGDLELIPFLDLSGFFWVGGGFSMVVASRSWI